MTRQNGKKASACQCNFNATIQALWNGKIPLMKVFWIYYFAVILGLAMMGKSLSFLDSVPDLLGMIWAGFMVKPIWVSADHYKGPQHWALGAKAASVLIGLGVIGNFLVF